MSCYQKKHSPTHTYHGHQSSLICFLHLLQSMASSLLNLHAWWSFSTISLQVFFGLPLGLAPSASYTKHFFTQSLSSFRSTCTYNRNLFCCSTKISHLIPVSLSTLYLELISDTHLNYFSKFLKTTYLSRSSWPSTQPAMSNRQLTSENFH